MAESAIVLTPGVGGPSADLEIVDNGNARQVVCLGDPALGARVMSVDVNGNAQVNVNNQPQTKPSDQCQSQTGATGAAITVTLPAVAGQFHYITYIEVTKYFTVANAASATPLVVTTTNLPGNLAFTFGQPVGAIGVTDRLLTPFDSPLKSSVVNTATTIVCPATTGIIWRVNVFYYTAA